MKTHETANMGQLIGFNHWLSSLDVKAITGWRWRKRGWVSTITIAGRQYISLDEIARFEKRAQAGEFVSAADEKQTSKTGGLNV